MDTIIKIELNKTENNENLKELENNIKENGLLKPLVVRKKREWLISYCLIKTSPQ